MNSDSARKVQWTVGVGASLASTIGVLYSLRDAIDWLAASRYVVDALTVVHIFVPLALSGYFATFNGRPLQRLLCRFFLLYTVASLWALLTDWIPVLFAREIRSLVYRGLMVGNCLWFAVSLFPMLDDPDDPKEDPHA